MTSTIVSDKTVKVVSMQQAKLLKTPLELLGIISYKFCIRLASTFHIGSFTSSGVPGPSTFLSAPLKMGKDGKVKREA